MIILFVVVLIIGGICTLLLIRGNENDKYVIKIDIVDEKSPDRKLSLLKDGREESFDSIYYLDDVYICDSNVPNTSKSALKDVKKLKVKLKSGKIIEVKVKKDDE